MKNNLITAAVIIFILLIALTGMVILLNRSSPAGIAVGMFGFVAVVCLIPFLFNRNKN